MSTLASLNLIRLFDFYLAAMFVLGTWRRVEFYRGVSGLVLTLPGRWPHLFHLVKQHRTVFLTWSTLRPLVLIRRMHLARAARAAGIVDREVSLCVVALHRDGRA